jgi:hypothetical protein
MITHMNIARLGSWSPRMRLLTCVTGLVLLLPATLAAQGRSPFPDRWLTFDAVATALALAPEQRAGVEPRYEAVNAVLQRATQRRDDARRAFQGQGSVKDMSESQRDALKARLASANAGFDGLQTELDGAYAALREQLTASQQAQFDGLSRPRIVPLRAAARAQAAAVAAPKANRTFIGASGKKVVLPAKP